MLIINDQFKLSFETNEIMAIKANSDEKRTKVEPRIMHVLSILIKNSPSVVSRKQLIEEVWNNYGGADDALNQAISHLRKKLNDKDKENRLIETVVKKGYRFTGNALPVSEDQKREFNRPMLIKLTIGIIVIIAAISAILILTNNEESETRPEGTENFVPLAPEAPVGNDTITVSNVPAPQAD